MTTINANQQMIDAAIEVYMERKITAAKVANLLQRFGLSNTTIKDIIARVNNLNNKNNKR